MVQSLHAPSNLRQGQVLVFELENQQQPVQVILAIGRTRPGPIRRGQQPLLDVVPNRATGDICLLAEVLKRERIVGHVRGNNSET